MVIPRPTTRLLALLEVLQARDLVSGTELARRLEVNGRSVRRYIAMLQEIGLPVETVRGPAGGYRLRPGYKLPPLMFTDEEAVALTLGLAGLARLGLALDPATVVGAQAKLERVLPATLRSRVQALEAGVALEPAPAAATAEGALVATLGAAAGDGRRMRLRYRSERGESDRAVDPYGVAHWSRAWYLVGHCHLRGGTRLFRLARILAAEPLAETFIPPPDFDPYAYVARAMVAYPGQWPVEILLRMPLAEAQRSTLAAYGTLTPTTDGVRYEGRFEDLDGLARWLVLLRHPFTIHEPPELRAALRALAQEVAALANQAAPRVNSTENVTEGAAGATVPSKENVTGGPPGVAGLLSL
jgi:predicted DNA-binding transcriptional regulator YafY